MEKFAQRHQAKFKASGKQKNTVYFHECCFTFTNRVTRSKTEHDDEGSLTWWDFQRIHMPETTSFAQALLNLSRARTDDLKDTVPIFNQLHPTDPLGKRKPPASVEESLRKRIAKLEEENRELRNNLKHRQTEQDKMYSMINHLRMQLVLAKGQQHFNYYCFDYLQKRLPKPLSIKELNSVQIKANLHASKEADIVLRQQLDPYPSEEVRKMAQCKETLIVGQDFGCAACRETLTLREGEETNTPSEKELAKQPEQASVTDILSLTSKASLSQ